MIKIKELTDELSGLEYGGKAAGLSLLCRNDFLLPKTLVIQAVTNPEVFNNSEFQEKLLKKLKSFEKAGKYSVALRSSCTIEDGFQNSMAGHFDSFLGNFTFETLIEKMKFIVEGLSKISEVSAKMGIIVQEKINASYSGVLFTSDPLTFSKSAVVLSLIRGLGEKLVLGENSGEDFLINLNNGEPDIEKLPKDISNALLTQLITQSKFLEKRVNYPLDIEWALQDSKLYFLQCRPLASITKVENFTGAVYQDVLKRIPKQLIKHEKIQLRLKALKKSVAISDAYLNIKNNSKQSTSFQKIEINESKYCKGYSAVMIYPTLLNHKVIRSFVGAKENLKYNMQECVRYGIRTYPKYENLSAVVKKYTELSEEEYWVSATIIQEIYNPFYTGIINKVDNGFVVEIIRGHFITKGVVSTSTYTLTNDFELLTKNEIFQHSWYEIIEGHTLSCSYKDGEADLVSLDLLDIRMLLQYFQAFLEKNGENVEFGLLDNPLENFTPYLIDSTNEIIEKNINISDIARGIISTGRVIGKVVIMSDFNDDSLDIHYKNQEKKNTVISSDIIFLAQRPDMSILDILERYDNSKIGFVFQEGSVLCHLAAILRERGIHAIKSTGIISGKESKGYYILDTNKDVLFTEI